MPKESSYTPEVADQICERLARGETLRGICRGEGMPSASSMLRWVEKDFDGLAERYADARARQIEHWADELLDISDDGSNDWMERNQADNPGWQLNGEHVQRSRLRSDNRKWLLSKLKPEKYGDRLETKNTTTLDVADPVMDLLQKIGESGKKIYEPKSE